MARFIECFIERPRQGEVYNIGGGRANSCSILEAFEIAERVSGRRAHYEYSDRSREGDHICYISDLDEGDHPLPRAGRSRSDLEAIFEEICQAWTERLAS